MPGFSTGAVPIGLGPVGLFQPIADALKFLGKEDVIPYHVDKWLYVFAPALMVFPAFFVFGVIPWGVLTIGGEDVLIQIGSTNIGVLFILAVASLSVYSITFGAWASNNKYSLFGGLRAASQMISYELAMGLALIGMILLVGSLKLEDIVAFQSGTYWGIVLQPLGALIFIVTAYAETNRLPFDLPETEAGACWGLPHGIQFDEIRHVLYGRVYEYDHRVSFDYTPFFRRMACAIPRRYGS